LDLGREDMYTVLYNIRKVAREPRHSKEHRRNVRIGNTATRYDIKNQYPTKLLDTQVNVSKNELKIRRMIDLY
jgi:hypothetical protein